MKKINNEASYQELKLQLDSVLETLQSDDLNVDNALKAYETGMELVKQLELKLSEAENKITKLKEKFE